MIHIVCGIPGTGKSTVTHYLAKKLDAEVVNTDSVHALLYPKGAHTANGDFTPESLDTVYRSIPLLAYYLAKVASDIDIIIEGSFRLESQRRAITSVLDKEKIKYALILVEVTNDEVVENRLTERLKTGHKGDFQNYLDIKEIYEKPENAVIIKNDGTIQELIIQIEQYIQALPK
jgi:predicted kinase